MLSRAETRPSLVFDEVDVGVGGRTAPVVGQKLWTVASAGHQVLCVTHMPQVAAYADCHYVVSRTPEGVCVSQVTGEQRLDELAAMLAGSISPAARKSAGELLARAIAFRKTCCLVRRRVADDLAAHADLKRGRVGWWHVTIRMAICSTLGLLHQVVHFVAHQRVFLDQRLGYGNDRPRCSSSSILTRLYC